LGLAARLALAAAGRGPDGWYAIFGERGSREYLPALPALDLGTPTFLDRFAEIAPSLPIHPSAHPPGTLLLLDLLGITTAEGMASLVIGLAALSVPLTYVLGRSLIDDGSARIATVLFAFAPSALIYGATSADGMFVTGGLLAAITLVAASRRTRAVGGLLAAAGSFFAYSLLAIPAWATLVIWRREGFRSAALLAVWCGAVLIAGYGLLYAATGFDIFGALSSADEAYRVGVANVRPYLYWLFGSPAAFLIAAGVPIAWYAVRALVERDDLAVALALVIAVAAIGGYTKSETERIWLFLVPLLCLAAARFLPARRVPIVIGLLCAQAVTAELLLDTAW
ncbi:MAG: hypothetical protein H0U42_02025, partial [Thermoleophilaceae bacterium]|nr:hypothetical protein [Thermoleophilaceae bacterium]